LDNQVLGHAAFSTEESEDEDQCYFAIDGNGDIFSLNDVDESENEEGVQTQREN
jgi:hypothetical protein